MTKPRPFHSRVLIKLSGEQFAGPDSLFSRQILGPLVAQIAVLRDRGVRIGIVVGGGNIYRGNRQEFARPIGDFMGMYATMINGLALSEFLRKSQIPTVLQSALTNSFPFDPQNANFARLSMENGKVVIFCGGTGKPFFSTDTAAAIAAIEMEADVILKLTDVDGIYEADPKRFPDAKKFDTVDFDSAIDRKLKILDEAAFVLCREHRIPIRVLSIHRPHGLEEVIDGRPIGTLAFPADDGPTCDD